MSIDARGGSWRARFNRAGRTYSRSFPSYAAAAAWEADALWRLEQGEEPVAPPAAKARPEVAAPTRPMTIHDACDDFVFGLRNGVITTRRGHRYKPSTIRGVENRLRLHVVGRIGSEPVATLRRGDVRRLIDDLAVEKSPATATNVRDALRLVLARQVDLEVIDQNVAANVRAPTVDHEPARFLEAGEADALQALADAHVAGTLAYTDKKDRRRTHPAHPCIGAFVATALGTGLRLGELQALVWGPGGLDLDRRVVTVKATRDRTGQLVEPKSRRSREVPLGPDLVARLRRYRMTCPRSADGDRVFWRSHRRAWEHVREAAGIPELRVHDLRHTAATHWLAAGLGVHAVADLLGHTGGAVLVLKLYGHALEAETSTAAERLEAWREAQRS